MGKDQRQGLPEKYQSLSYGIGLLRDHVGNRMCTAFCVADDVIVTNAHCLAYRLVKKRREIPNVRDFVFYLLRNGDVVQRTKLKVNRVGAPGAPGASILAGVLPDPNVKLRPEQLIEAKYKDWALAKLRRPACIGDELVFAEPDLLSDATRLLQAPTFLIGFHGDKINQDRLHRYSPCRVKRVKVRDGRGLLHHTCDMVSGASGSPIFMQTDAGPRVIGINSGVQMWYTYERAESGDGERAVSWSINMAVSPLAFLRKVERYHAAAFVNQAVTLQELQLRLQNAGHLSGSTEAHFGPATRAALIRYERSLGVVPLGVPTADMIKRLATR